MPTIQVTVGHSQYSLSGLNADEQEPPYRGGNGLVWVNRQGDAAVIRTGLDNGDLPVIVEFQDAALVADLSDWEEVVEISMTITGPDLIVASPYDEELDEDDDGVRLPADAEETRSYRVRVHARGRDQGREAFSVDADEGEEMIEQHLIVIWPAPPASETTLKATDRVGEENRSHS